jgi:hypothetical protein
MVPSDNGWEAVTGRPSSKIVDTCRTHLQAGIRGRSRLQYADVMASEALSVAPGRSPRRRPTPDGDVRRGADHVVTSGHTRLSWVGERSHEASKHPKPLGTDLFCQGWPTCCC